MIGVDHPAYENNVFLNFPKHCENEGNLNVPLTAYVMMIDYTEEIGPLPTEDVPLFTTLRFQQEAARVFGIPEVRRVGSVGIFRPGIIKTLLALFGRFHPR